MTDPQLLRVALRALDEARPDHVITELRKVLSERLGSNGVRLLLANYERKALLPVMEPESTAGLSESASHEAYSTQLPVSRPGVDGGTEISLPVCVHGDRLAVLQVTMPRPPDDDELDQLHDLAMLAGYSLEATRGQTDLLRRAARTRRLTLAAELQWQLLPGRGCRAPEYELAGHLEPAYDIHAANFDWSQDHGYLVVGVTDSSTLGRQPPLMLTTLAVTGMRNARRSDLGIVDQTQLADQAVFAHFQGTESVDTLLMRIDLDTGRVGAVLAGSPRLLILRGGTLHRVELTDQLPLGMFGDTEYVEERVDLVAEDRLLLVSDGLHAAPSPRRKSFGDSTLPQVLKSTADLPPALVVRRIVDELIRHHGTPDLEHDATVICLDWHGPTSERAGDATSTAAAGGSILPLNPSQSRRD